MDSDTSRRPIKDIQRVIDARITPATPCPSPNGISSDRKHKWCKDGHTLCCICFNCTPNNDLYIDAEGAKWDFCRAGTCAEEAGVVRHYYSQGVPRRFEGMALPTNREWLHG